MASRRRKVMGLPIGPRQRKFTPARAVRFGAVGASALAAVPLASRGVRAAGRAGDAFSALGDIEDAVSSHSSTLGKAGALVHKASQLRKGEGADKPKLAHLIEEHIDIAVPRSVAYNQWTQMEVLPGIVKGVVAVEQEEDDEVGWTARIGPVRREWKARITEQVPDERIAWRSQGGPEHQGVVTFHSLDEDLTHVMVQMHYHPHGPLEVVANKLRIQRRRVRRDLRLFKHFLELRGEETGEWRGSIGRSHQPQSGRSPATTPPSGRARSGSGPSDNGRAAPKRGTAKGSAAGKAAAR